MFIVVPHGHCLTASAREDTDEVRNSPGLQRSVVNGEKSLPGMRTSSIYGRTAVAYAAATAVLMPIVEPHHLVSLLPGAMPGVGGLVSFWTALAALRNKYLFGFLCAHEVINDFSSDIIAQAATLDRNKIVPKDEKRLVLDWRRVWRSMSSAMISDDFPFLLWSRAMWAFSEWAVSSLRASTSLPARLVSTLTHPLGMATIKMLVTQVVYEPISSGGYLAIQAVLRGKSWKGVVAEVRSKLYTAWSDGLVYWSLAHMFVFLMPFWWLQPIADNIATLFFNSYLSILSNDVQDGDGDSN